MPLYMGYRDTELERQVEDEATGMSLDLMESLKVFKMARGMISKM